ncbi:hypothetical protein GQ53DRAFT_749803 [Thozetella sp. PMI_491]|nr:hypothetical protein GQ53DRAFT_749803 [Thozetella sp. PMI_491]
MPTQTPALLVRAVCLISKRLMAEGCIGCQCTVAGRTASPGTVALGSHARISALTHARPERTSTCSQPLTSRC